MRKRRYDTSADPACSAATTLSRATLGIGTIRKRNKNEKLAFLNELTP
jgi:hypothetical protein